MFSLENLNKYIAEHDGCKSIIMPLLEDRIISYTKDKRSGFHEDEYYMLYEFCMFDDDYFRIKKDIIENRISLDVVDIGCQAGFQSEIFLDRNYLGIECTFNFFFNEERKNVSYLTDKFPIRGLDISNKIVISNMSLGYFNCFLGEGIGKKGVLSDTDLMLIDELSKSHTLYCNSKPCFINELKSRFTYHKYLGSADSNEISTGVYKFWN